MMVSCCKSQPMIPVMLSRRVCRIWETNEETLIREFKEEIGADIKVKEIKWGVKYFPMGRQALSSICLYYILALDETQILAYGKFIAHEHIEGRDFDINLLIPLSDVGNIEVYPSNAIELFKQIDEGVNT